MKNILSFFFLLCGITLAAQTTTTITKELDTLVQTSSPIYRTIKVGTLAYKDSTVKSGDTLISILKKYKPPTEPPPSATINFAFTAIPFSDPDIISPGRGAEQWHNGSARIPNPTESSTQENALDVYYRFPWSQIETGEGIYNWSFFDGLILSAMNKNQKLSFGIMPHRSEANVTGSVSYAGGSAYYPAYLHNKMQAETYKDFLQQGVWIPNYNSPNYIGRLTALHKAIRDHLVTKTLTPTSGIHAGKPVLAGDAIYCIDIRGFGTWGEFHFGSTGLTWTTWPTGRQPTAASLKSIIDAHTQTFDKWPLVMMVAAYDGGYTGINVFARLPEVAYYALTARNAWGAVGFRRDQWGATDSYLNNLMAGNNLTYNGSPAFKTFILDKYKYAPVTGEPNPVNSTMTDLLNHVSLYHATSFGNGNFGSYPSDIAVRDRIRESFKKCGYRIELKSGSATTSSGKLSITLNWQNTGISPTYESWDVVYELVSSNTVVWAANSTFKPKLFQPSTTATPITDVFTDVPSGNYTLRIRIKETSNYRANLPIAIKGRNSDGSYNLGSVNL